MKRAVYLMIVALACVQFVGCQTAKKSDARHSKMECCDDMNCCKGMKTDGACSPDCKKDCCG